MGTVPFIYVKGPVPFIRVKGTVPTDGYSCHTRYLPWLNGTKTTQ